MAVLPKCVINILNSDRVSSLVASRDIQKGEEIVMNYLDPYRAKKPSLMLRFERRSAMKSCGISIVGVGLVVSVGRSWQETKKLSRTLSTWIKEGTIW